MPVTLECTVAPAPVQGLTQLWNCERKRFACRTKAMAGTALSSSFLPTRSSKGLCSASSWKCRSMLASSSLAHLRVSSTEPARSYNGNRLKKFPVEALSSSCDAENYGSDTQGELPSGPVESDSSPSSEPRKFSGNLQTVGVVVAILGIGTLAALALTLNSGGTSALLSSVSKSGFPAAFSLIFVSEIGDKTFFIAALMAMRQNKWLVLTGATAALAIMSIISVVIGKLFQKVPAQLKTSIPIGEYAAVALLIWFGLRSIKNAWDTPSAPAGVDAESEEGELAEARAYLKQSDGKEHRSPLEFLSEVFTLIFVAEWGDRSMLATIALGAAQSPFGVASGAIVGHFLATLIAVLGGSFLAKYISEKVIGYCGGFLFLAFAAATLGGVF